MPKEIKNLKDFMKHLAPLSVNTEAKDNKPVPKNTFQKKLTVKRNKRITKFKLRTKKYLLTFKTSDGKIIKRILNNLPSSIEKVDIKNRAAARRLRKK